MDNLFLKKGAEKEDCNLLINIYLNFSKEDIKSRKRRNEIIIKKK